MLYAGGSSERTDDREYQFDGGDLRKPALGF
jgi:hypothetical protein